MNYKTRITIFTPTFNRRNRIVSLYESLRNQSRYDFEWVVVDDGSSDGTGIFFNSIMDQTSFSIKYFYQENAGKHAAINVGIDHVSGEYFVCVDSDDVLKNDAIETILNSIERLPEESIGIILKMELDGYDDSQKWKKIDGLEIDAIDIHDKYGIKESVLVTKTRIIKKYRFPIIYDENGMVEKYCPECVLHTQFIPEGQYYVVNKCIYIAEYLDDGLTKNLFTKTWVDNPNGALRGLVVRFAIAKKYTIFCRVLARAKCIMNINALCMVTKKSVFMNTPSLAYTIVLLIPSIAFRYYRFGK